MRGCHFQDVFGRCSICLRDLSTDALDLRTLRFCDEQEEAVCEHRGWEHQTHLDVCRARSCFTDSCPHCGGKHRTVEQMLRCNVDRALREALSNGEKWSPAGTSLNLIGDDVPENLRSGAWRKMRKKVVERDGNRCQECGRDLSQLPAWFTEVHHVLPRVRGGGDHPANLKTLCVVCHRLETEKLQWQMMWESGRDAKQEG